MRATGQVRSDLMALRALISNGVSTVTGKIDDLESSLSPVATSGSYSDLTDTPTLSAVATSGAYADLTGKPTLGALASQDTVTHSQVSDWSSATSGFATTSSLAAVATSGAYSDLTGKPTLGALASLDSITTASISNWASATSGFLTASSLTPYAKTADLATVATTGAYSDLSGKPTIPTVPTDVSAFTNDAGYLTAHQDISHLLPLAGGLMSGGITVTANITGFLKRNVDTGYLQFFGGSGANLGACLILSGGQRSGYEGLFRLSARTSSSNIKNLDGLPDGTLTWDDNAILHEGLAPSQVEITLPAVTELTTHTIKCHRYGKVVMVKISVTLSAALSSATTVATGLPAPAEELYDIVNTWTSSYRRPIRARITTAGALTFQYGYATSYNHVITYLAA